LSSSVNKDSGDDTSNLPFTVAIESTNQKGVQFCEEEEEEEEEGCRLITTRTFLS
jgi:hypothetical protein